MTKIPINFDGAKFAQKYNLDPFKDFYDDGNGNIVCQSMPNLTDADLLDCVVNYEVGLSPSQQIILADGTDAARVVITGAPGATVDYTVNGQPFQTTLDASGTEYIELTCDTPNTTMVVVAGTARAVIYAVEVLS